MMRDEKIDTVKGICLVLMVVCHTDFEHYCFLRRVVHLFHMPVFLMAAGWFFSSVKVESLDKYLAYVIGKIRRLWMPYVLTTLLVVVLCPLLVLLVGREPLVDYVREFVKGVCMCSQLPERSPLWFLSSLFWVYVFYGGFELCLMVCRIKSLIPQTVLSALFCLFGKFAHGWVFTYIGGPQVFVCYALFHLGVLCRTYSVKIRDESMVKNGIIAFSLILFLLVMGLLDHVGLAQNNYFSGLTVPFVSTAGWLMCYSLAVLMGKTGRVGWIFAYIGRHTMPILLFHMLLFQFVGWMIALCGFLPVHALSHHPTCFSGITYVIIYSVIGIVMPLALNVLWRRMSESVRSIVICR